MGNATNVRTWTCERDDQDPAAPFIAMLRIGDELIASGRGAEEVAAYAALVDALDRQGVSDGQVLGMQDLMRRRKSA
jgi:hypothetical protein